MTDGGSSGCVLVAIGLTQLPRDGERNPALWYDTLAESAPLPRSAIAELNPADKRVTFLSIL
jgi:hypothetical protein